MPGLVPGIHVLTSISARKTWMAGASPATTKAITDRSTREQFLQRGVDHLDVVGAGAGAAGEMTPIGLDHPQLGVRHVLDLDGAVLGREIEIRRGWHDDGLGLDPG